ncbi:MAG: tyrosine-type recombinase/integrase [Thermoguttaceae bacterium]|jgi:integrase
MIAINFGSNRKKKKIYKTTEADRLLLERVAVLFMRGGTYHYVAKELGKPLDDIIRLRRMNTKLWHELCDKELEAVKAETHSKIEADLKNPILANRNEKLLDENGQTHDPQAMALEGFYENYYKPMKLLGRSSHTRIDYFYSLTKFNKWLGRQAKLSDLTDELVTKYMASMLDKDLSIGQVNHQRRIILALWRFAFKKKLIGQLPDIDKLREYKRVPKCWSMEEYGKIIAIAKKLEGEVAPTYFFGKQKRRSGLNDNPANKWWPALLLLAYDTGLRIGAILAIKPEYIDFEKGWLRIPAETQKQKADQTFMLHTSTIEALREVEPLGGYLFYFPYSRQSLNRVFRKIIEKAGVWVNKGMGSQLFHIIRKTTATYIADKLGGAAAMAYLGHSCMQVTQAYLDPTKIHSIRAVDVLPRPELPQPEAFKT